jgi:cobalt-zinc-cadmium efflux system protein
MFHHHDKDTQNITIAFILNALFVIVEVIAGLLTNSIAILSDALHDFGDCISLGITWVLQKKAQQGRDTKYSYGYKRFTLLGSIFLGGILAISSLFVIKEAIGRILDSQEVDAIGMLWIAIVGVLINGVAAFRLKKGNSMSQRAVYLHIMEDVLGWVAVLVSSIVMLFWKIPILDSLLSIAISCWVIYNVWRNLKSTFAVLLQATPIDVDVNQLEQQILAIDNVVAVHDIHVWSMDGERHVMSLHVVVDAMDVTIRQRVKESLCQVAKRWNIYHVTHELELQGEICEIACE